MSSGLIHIYCGDGKGKTTAAVGLAVRASGAGKKVLFSQFLKSGLSSEIAVLQMIDGITIRHCDTERGWVRDMTDSQREQAACDYDCFLRDLFREAAGFDLFVLDEVSPACNHGLVSQDGLVELLERKPEGLEVVITGREPSGALAELADYVTVMKKIKHPFDRGVMAREGIEF